MSEERPNEKDLQTASFVVHATRGVIRDKSTRRRAMLVVLGAAMLLLVLGSTVLASSLNPHDHPAAFILFWVACGWLTLTAVLLALFDLLVVRAEARRSRRALHAELKPPD